MFVRLASYVLAFVTTIALTTTTSADASIRPEKPGSAATNSCVEAPDRESQR